MMSFRSIVSVCAFAVVRCLCRCVGRCDELTQSIVSVCRCAGACAVLCGANADFVGATFVPAVMTQWMPRICRFELLLVNGARALRNNVRTDWASP